MYSADRIIFLLHKWWRILSPYMVSVVFAAILIHGSFTYFWRDKVRTIAILILFATWIMVLGTRSYRRFVGKRSLPTREREDLELGLMLILGTYAMVQAFGGFGSAVYPLVFIPIALLVAHTSQKTASILAFTAIGIEFAVSAFGPQESSFYESAIHALVILSLVSIHMVPKAAKIARMKRFTSKTLEANQPVTVDDAAARRHPPTTEITPGRENPPEYLRRRDYAPADPLKRTMHHHIALLKHTMKLNTCAVLWLDEHDENLMVRMYISDTNHVIPTPFNKGNGIFGAILKNRKTLRLEGIKPGYGGLVYYTAPIAVTDFIGVPFPAGDNVMGILCADRTDGRSFEQGDVDAITASAENLLSIIANEKLFHQLQKAKTEQSKLLLASEILSRNSREQDVAKAALDAAAEIAHFELGAVALVMEDGCQMVREASGSKSEGLIGAIAGASESLAAAALKNRQYLPYQGKLDPKQQILLSKSSQPIFAKMQSAIVLPLVSGETPLGTMILASSKTGAFTDEVRTTLQVMTNQLGTILENAGMYKKLEELATTDGLTGLPNHRIFQDILSKKIASSTRFGGNLSLIFCDVDHFKNVNDTYGHPVGDLVLKRLASVLQKEVVRDTDMPARYGGEEFAIICEGTDTEGAVKLAERIRQKFEKETYYTDQGMLKVTISIGIATCPIHARTKQDLIEHADTALYAAKTGGRNQVQTWQKGMAPHLLHKKSP